MTARRFALAIVLALALIGAKEPQTDPRLKNAFRQPPKNGWTFVHLEGTPSEIGFQHGYLLAPEILDAQKVTALELNHDHHRNWAFFRNAAKTVLWPHIEQEYRDELEGIAAGLSAHGVKMDVWDVTALNASLEWSYYMKQYNEERKTKKASPAPGDHCSAFAATGSYTADGKVILAHNNWTSYLDGERWTMVFDIVPEKGYRFIMDGFPGLIHSADDFGINAGGIMITETTITGFAGWDSNGIPEFVRARKAMQYSNSIDDFARIMKEGNNGGYANDWLLADRKNNEIASLELGLKNVTLERKTDGYFVGSNFPINEKLIKEETNFAAKDMSNSANARHVRWDQLMAENKGRIDVAMAEKFLGDHYDSYEKRENASERTLCGHVDLSAHGLGDWQPPYGPAGAVQNKVADATMAEKLTLQAYAGHACGLHFKAAAHLAKHPEFKWQKDLLRDMDAKGWAEFSAAR
jgi:hypothetical protein